MQVVNAATIPRSEKVLRRAQCPPSIALGDCVSIVGPKVGRLLDVALADPSAVPFLPAVGVVTRKYTATLCRVQLAGPMRDTYTGLTEGRSYYLSAAGRLTLTPPTFPLAAQLLGVALDPVEFLIHWQGEAGGGTVAASAHTLDDKRLPASATFGDGDAALGSAISHTPLNDGYVFVSVNGHRVSVADGLVSPGACYFSGNGGVTRRLQKDIQAGDTLHWVGSVAGYQLEAGDLIDLDYEEV